MPLSIAFALPMIDTGIHLIYTGVRLGNQLTREQQKVEEYETELRIQNLASPMLTEEEAARSECNTYY